MEYNFLLKYSLPGGKVDLDDVVERLGEVGCTDALVGVGVAGRFALDFIRDAETARKAIESALADVRKAVPEAALVEASPDFVGLTDVAELLSMSRQNIRKLMLSHDDFPLPVHEGSTSVWHLADVLAWLDRRRGQRSDQALREAAVAALEVNLAREADRYARIGSKEIRKLVESGRPPLQ